MIRFFIKLSSILSLFFVSSLVANAIGTDFQLFNPTHVPDKYFTVNSSQTLAAGRMNLGMFVDGAWNSLPYEATTTGTINERRGFTDYDDILLQMDLHIALGIIKGWDIGISLPLVFQTLKDNVNKVIFEAEGLTEARLTSKLRLWGDNKNGVAVVGTISKDLIRDNPFMGDGSGLNLQVQLAANGNLSKKVDAAINVGYRMRDPGEKIVVLDDAGNVDVDFPITPFDDQATASLAVGYRFNKHYRFIWEVYGAHNLEEVEMRTFRKQTMAETIFGLRYRPSQNLYFYGGLGTELIHSVASPDYRAFIGVNYTPRVWDVKTMPKEPIIVEPEVEEIVEQPVVEEVAQQEEAEPAEQFTAKNILFETNSHTKILQQSREELSRIGQYLRTRGFGRIVIEGHTDSDGSDNYNLVLSQKRADSIKQYLVINYNFPPDNIMTKGYGESQPITENETAQGKKQNRRVEFKVFDNAVEPSTTSQPPTSDVTVDISTPDPSSAVAEDADEEPVDAESIPTDLEDGPVDLQDVEDGP